MSYRIWIINHHAQNPGRHTILATGLALRGNDVTLFAASLLHNQDKDIREYPPGVLSLAETDGLFQRVWLKTPRYYGSNIKRGINEVVFARRVVQAAGKMERPDIIIGSSVHLFAPLAAYRLARRKGVPFIFEVRDLWPQTLIDMGVLPQNGLTARFFRRLEMFLYKKAVKIISVLPQGVDYIAPLGIDPARVVHIPNGVNLQWFDACIREGVMDEAVQECFAASPGRLTFTYAGAHGLANGLDTLVNAAKILQEEGNTAIRLLLVGDGPEKKKLKEQVRLQQLQNITFLPQVKKEQIPLILSKSDACIFHLNRTPVFKYGISSNKLFDYLASRRPLISAVEASFDFARVSGGGISVPPEDPRALAKAIMSIAAMPAEGRLALGHKGREFVEEHHDYNVLTENLDKLILSLLETCTKKGGDPQ